MFPLLLWGTSCQHMGGSQTASDGARLQSAAGGDRVCCVQGEKGEPGERGDKGNPGELVGHLSHFSSATSAIGEGRFGSSAAENQHILPSNDTPSTEDSKPRLVGLNCQLPLVLSFSCT